jgi:hypothetical protein
MYQCSGSMTFWGGSGSGSSDPCFWLVDPDPDPAIFVIGLQDVSKKLIINKNFFAYYFLKVHLHHFSKIKCQKESQNRRNQGFSYYFSMTIEGSGSGSMWLVDPDPGGPKTCGSGSGTLLCTHTIFVAYRTNVRIDHFYIYPTAPAPVVCLTVITAFSVSALKLDGFLICYYILFLQNSRFGTVCSPFLHFFTRGHRLFWTRGTNIFKIYELPAFYFEYRYLAWFYTIFYP